MEEETMHAALSSLEEVWNKNVIGNASPTL